MAYTYYYSTARDNLSFAANCASSPAPIYWHIVLRVYSPCANILVLHMLSVNELPCLKLPECVPCLQTTHIDICDPKELD